MPGKDGTGPFGFGAMSGRGFGGCGPYGAYSGCGLGLGRKGGFAANRGGYSPYFQPVTKDFLEEQKSFLQNRIAAIDKELETK